MQEHRYGKGDTEVYTTDEIIRAIRVRNKDNVDRINHLEEENKKLKDDKYKDEELQKMKSKLEEMKKDYYRGFPISESENKAIKEWKNKHEEEVHGLITDNMKLKAQGVSGGRYTYIFYPTALGTSGVVKCGCCGAEFEFQELG